MDKQSWQFETIGVVHTLQKYRYETPRQGVFSGCDGEIELFRPYGGDAIADLAGFDRIWVIFCFHLNSGKNWKPKVRPPFPAGGSCRSIFATRSPYRINPLGLSCVELAGIRDNILKVRHIDMLDGTPVLDIKPYIPEADAFPDSAAGWRDEVPQADALRWQVEYSELFTRQSAFIMKHAALDLYNFAAVQLANEPLDSSRKRLKHLEHDRWSLGCRTWKIIFCADEKSRRITVEKVESNYSVTDLAPGAADPYADKEIHRLFLQEW